MYIRRITIENIRGFRQLDFSLAHAQGSFPGWSVFTGDNGSGKTALLKAVALAVNGPAFARALEPSLRGWVRKGASEGTLTVEIVQGGEDTFRGGGRTGPWFRASLSITDPGNGGEPTLVAKTSQKKGPTRGPWFENPQGWFSCGYGPFRRLYGESSDAQRVMSGPGPVARFATMFREDASLIECERWLRDIKYRSLDRAEKESPELDVITGLLNDEFLQNGMRIDKVDSTGVFLRDRASVVLPLKDMSDGYRAALALLVDILRHMVSVYGWEGLTSGGPDGPIVVNKDGVVLIDEIDSHLHPEWQRQIGFWLKRKFPKVQFLVTTHSPLICQAADAKGIFHLPPPGSDSAPFQVSDEDYLRIIQSKPDSILLSPAFGLKHTRSPRVVGQHQRLSELTAKLQAGCATPEEVSELNALKRGLLPLLSQAEG